MKRNLPLTQTIKLSSPLFPLSILLIFLIITFPSRRLSAQNPGFDITVTSETMQEFFGLGISMHSAKTYFLPSNTSIKQKLYSETFSGFNTFSFWSYIENPSTRDQVIATAKQYGLKRIIMNPTMRDNTNTAYTPMEHANQQLLDVIEYLAAGYPIYGLTVMNKLNTNESDTRRVDPAWPVEFLKLFSAKLDSAGITGIKLGGPSTIEWAPYVDPTLTGASHGYGFQPGDNMMYLNAIMNDPDALAILDAIELQSYGWSHTEEVQQLAIQHGKEQWVALSATDGISNNNGDPVLSPVSAANLLANINHGVTHWNYWVWDQLANFNTGELNRRGKVLQHIGKSFQEGALVRKVLSNPYVFSERMFWNFYDINNPANNRQPELVAAAAENKDGSFVIGLVNLSGVEAQHFNSKFYAAKAKVVDVNLTFEEFQPNQVAVFQIQRSDPNGAYSTPGNAYLFKNKMTVSINPQDLLILKTGEILVSDDVFMPEHKPADLMAEQNNDGHVDLTWIDNAPNEAEFIIERRLKGADDFVLVATVPENTTAFTDTTTLSANSTYEYKVTAISHVQIGTIELNDSIASEVAEVMIQDVTGILSILEADIRIYPNPTNGRIKISSNTFNEECLLQIFNMSGSLVKSEMIKLNQHIDISALPDGIYSMRIGHEKGYIIKKIVLVR
jgi:hypothetical protein